MDFLVSCFNIIISFFDLMLHIDVHLQQFAEQYGVWMVAVLILIVFCETGLVVTPFLPGDSLLFAAGALAAQGHFSLSVLFIGLLLAAISGDALNYYIGRKVGLAIFKPDARILKTAYLEKTHEFYERYGGKTIIIARFVPIVRTFAPFVAGAGSMSYHRFTQFNIAGALLWVSSMLSAGYLFGNLAWVKNNFSLVVLAIIGLSCLPAVWEWWCYRKRVRYQV